MKRYCRLLAIMLGGVLLMTSLSACGQKETIPANRTREQYELEKEFQPLFDFLAEEKKDLSDVEVYSSLLLVSSNHKSTPDSYSISLSGGDNPSGDYTIRENGEEIEHPVSFQNNQLIYESEISPEYDIDVFNLCLKPEFFERLSIIDYMAKHPETSIKSISYDVTSLNLFPEIKSKYSFGKEATTTLRIKISGYNAYSIKVHIGDATHDINISNNIITKSGDTK